MERNKTIKRSGMKKQQICKTWSTNHSVMVHSMQVQKTTQMPLETEQLSLGIHEHAETMYWQSVQGVYRILLENFEVDFESGLFALYNIPVQEPHMRWWYQQQSV